MIVTEKVGAKEERPKPLGEVFQTIDREAAFEIAGQIVGQVHQLGDLLNESKQLSSLLWPAHDEQNLKDQWQSVQQRLSGMLSPLIRSPFILTCAKLMRKCGFGSGPLFMGDLHMSNVALDSTPKGMKRIFLTLASSGEVPPDGTLRCLRSRSCSITT